MKQLAKQIPADATLFDDLGLTVASREPLAHHTWLGVGGEARYFCEPVDIDALSRLVIRARETGIALRMIGGGSNILIPTAGFDGMIVRLSAPAFSTIAVRNTSGIAGAGAKLVHVVCAAVQAGLSGIETLVGIPGTIGGALVGNAGGHGGDLGESVKEVTVMLPTGQLAVRRGTELAFQSRWSNLDDCIVIGCQLDLDEDSAELLTKRMQKQWIVGRSEQPSGTRTVAMMFKDPHGTSAESLITQAGAKDLRVGEAMVYAAHANYVVVFPKCSSDDVRLLVELVRSKVRERLGVELTPQIEVW
ncbi:MAG: FAD-binding protein [Planctomycetota bacterium]|nr:MAG: FAD-binding protein [Planctomycetota bacterium]